jgi:circadian clock protein KaiB
MSEPIVFSLFVTGRTARSQQAVRAMKELCSTLGNDIDFTIIDVLEQPETAEKQRVLATPTLVKHSPGEERRVIGDLADLGQVRKWLNLPG